MNSVLVFLFSVVTAFAVTPKTPQNQADQAWWDCSALVVEKNDRWPIDGPLRYGHTFSILLNKLGYKSESGDFFIKMIQARKARGEAVHALDLFGSGFFAQPDADTITGLRYGSMRLEKNEVLKGQRIPPQVYGDIREESTWSTLDKSMKTRNIPGFDVVAMRPIAGWNQIYNTKQEEKVLKFILNNVIARLNPGGEFYFSIGSRFLKIEQNQLQEKYQAEVWSKGFEMICVDNSINVTCVVRKRSED